MGGECIADREITNPAGRANAPEFWSSDFETRIDEVGVQWRFNGSEKK
jgi:uncharacterized glyoxalase superfamily protein PhnB